jgi:4-diphosphocytidyl-2-C-methyl-D-erythritol kinase
MVAEDGIITETAWAKVNLTLHVGRVITKGKYKGYHPVDSLVVFADFGDELSFEAAEEARLEISGPFSEGLEANSENLVLKALSLTDAPPQKVRLEKNIPVSAGLGGGSANAAAVLRRFDPDQRVNEVSVGADVPVCRQSRTALMRGIGEDVTPVLDLGQIPAIIVNPLIAVSTGAIFKAFDSVERETEPEQNATQGSLLERALTGQNDLQSVAIENAPVISRVLSEIKTQDTCQLARMSGSGASCFGLFETKTAAKAAASAIKKSNPKWWVKACQLGDTYE